MSNQAENLNGAQRPSPTGPTPNDSNLARRISAALERARAIIVDPTAAWQVIKSEPTSIKDIYQNYVVFLAAVPPIASLVGLIGAQAPFISTLLLQILLYGFSLGIVYVSAVVLEKLAPKFEAKTDTTSAFKLVAYSTTPAWVAGIFGVLPLLMPLAALIGFGYSIYIFFLGVQPMTAVPESRKLGYVAVSALVIFLLCVLLLRLVA